MNELTEQREGKGIGKSEGRWRPTTIHTSSQPITTTIRAAPPYEQRQRRHGCRQFSNVPRSKRVLATAISRGGDMQDDHHRNKPFWAMREGFWRQKG
uniref:Uncharacterized protein n=1 Tax=Panagrellus redivivus TaxID=6233 RepID=A0A7E4VLP4_PANRE